MLFRLSSNLEEFQRRLTNVLSGINGRILVADNILFYEKGTAQAEAVQDHNQKHVGSTPKFLLVRINYKFVCFIRTLQSAYMQKINILDATTKKWPLREYQVHLKKQYIMPQALLTYQVLVTAFLRCSSISTKHFQKIF